MHAQKNVISYYLLNNFKNTKNVLLRSVQNALHLVNDFHSSKHQSNHKPNFTLIKQAKIMKKFMIKDTHRNKRNFVDFDTISKASVDLFSGKTHRRKKMLEALFMDHITTMIANEEILHQLQDYSFDITNVKISLNYQDINVWWHSKDAVNLKNIAKVLDENSGKIRSILTSQNVVGRVPNIHFVLDNQISKLSELECALTNADFGPDYIRDPTSYFHAFKTGKAVQSLETLVREKFEAMRDGPEKRLSWKEELKIPSDMKLDVLKLNYSRIMEIVVQKKAKRNFNLSKSNQTNEQQDINLYAKMGESEAYKTTELKSFLVSRKVARKKESRKTKIDKEFGYFALNEALEKQNDLLEQNNCSEETDFEDGDDGYFK